MNIESIAMQIIINSGDARSNAFKALEHAKNGDFVGAENCLNEAKEKALDAHRAQTELLQKEASGDNMKVTLLMVHAQDHLMTSMLAKDLISEMVDLIKVNNELKVCSE
ncbi:MAG: PTS lactose/cellobiose transporter subunit IIA [Clostridia bacterium]|nr:PTS lactose/cellobiose transporter subunit IIA [Clostridia bacterium]